MNRPLQQAYSWRWNTRLILRKKPKRCCMPVFLRLK
jgi:hypothetical protein